MSLGMVICPSLLANQPGSDFVPCMNTSSAIVSLSTYHPFHTCTSRHGGCPKFKFANKIIQWKAAELHDELRPCLLGGSKPLMGAYGTVSDYCTAFLAPIMDEVFADLSAGLKRNPAVSADSMIVSKLKRCGRRRCYHHQSVETWMLTLLGTIRKLKDLGVYSDLGVIVYCEGHEMVGYMTPAGRGDTSNKWRIRCSPPEELIQLILHSSKKREPISAKITVLDGLLPLKRAYVACHKIPGQCSCLPWFENTITKFHLIHTQAFNVQPTNVPA